VPAADYASGRAAQEYPCNAEQVGQYGTAGGYKVHRYTDRAGRSCAFYDSTLLFPKNVADDLPGTYVMDMTGPARPVRTAVLATPAMQTPHESLVLSERRGLLLAVSGNPVTEPGIVDVYDVSEDCRRPVLRSSTPSGSSGTRAGCRPTATPSGSAPCAAERSWPSTWPTRPCRGSCGPRRTTRSTG
jgi:hypothetical protein